MQNGEVLAFGRNYRAQIGTGTLTNGESTPFVVIEGDNLEEKTTCQTIKQFNPESRSGLYTINPDGQGGVAPFNAYCEMERMGGGWTLYARHKDGTHKTQAQSTVTPSVFGVMPNSHWQSTLASMTFGMMFVDEHGRETRISKAKLQSGSCRKPADIHSPSNISLIGDFQTIWHDEKSGCSVSGSDYSLILLMDSSPSHSTFSYQGAALFQESNIAFDVWPYGTLTTSQSLQNELLYYIK